MDPVEGATFQGTPISTVEPALLGTHGEAWKQDFSKRTPIAGAPPVDLTVGSWLLRVPHAHPVWTHYWLVCVALRDVEGVPPAIVHRPGATHEIILYALHPDLVPPIDAHPRYMTPPNFVGQWIAESDAAAAKFVEEIVQKIIDGDLDPDTDGNREWVEIFGDYCFKGRY